MNQARLTEIPVVFYRTSGGAEPVLDWLRGLPAADRRVIGTDLATVQFGWPIGMPLCRPLGNGLWEVRCSLPSQRIARLLFFVENDRSAWCMDLSRRRRKHRPMISTSPGGG